MSRVPTASSHEVDCIFLGLEQGSKNSCTAVVRAGFTTSQKMLKHARFNVGHHWLNIKCVYRDWPE